MAAHYMDFRRLSCFVAVVEQKSFRAAALKLHLSQPPLTRHVQVLEEALGVQLLVRSAAGVEPTAAGRLFYDEARNLLALAAQAGERVRLTGQGRIGRLDVGVFGSAVLGAIPRIVREFRERHPEVELVLHSLDREAQLKALRERRIDVGFNRFFTEEPDLVWEVIHTEPMSVVVPEGHAFGTRSELGLAELARETLILYPRTPRPGFIDHLMRLFHQRGLSPRRVQEVDDVLTAAALVASHLGLSLVTESGRSLSLPGIVHVPLAAADRATVDLCIIQRRDEEAVIPRAFVEVARALGRRDAEPAGGRRRRRAG